MKTFLKGYLLGILIGFSCLSCFWILGCEGKTVLLNTNERQQTRTIFIPTGHKFHNFFFRGTTGDFYVVSIASDSRYYVSDMNGVRYVIQETTAEKK